MYDRPKRTFREWLTTWDTQKRRGLILWGGAGVGKTSLVYDLAEHLSYKVVEFNASDQRSADFVEYLNELANQRSLLQRNIILLLDEADGFGSALRGLKNVIEKTNKPIVLTVNNISKVGSLRKSCKEIYIPEPEYADVDFQGVKDYRQAKLMKEGSQGYQIKLSREKRLKKFLKEGRYEDLDLVDLTLLLDSSTQLYGWDLYEFIKGLECCDYTKHSECLSGIRAQIEITEMFYSKKKSLKA